MKKGFTLVELLIVVVILVTLMTMTFRLGNISSESEKRSKTIARIQRLENALSGYYAAFGMYPPVKQHNSPNVFLKVDGNGRQSEDDESTTISPGQAIAACRAQPMGCEFPFHSSMSDVIKAKSEAIPSELGVVFDDGYTDNPGRHMNRDSAAWSKTRLFKFGVMSYLLPRYLFMMNGQKEFFNGGYKQWSDNNIEPCDALTGEKMSWQRVRDNTGQGSNDNNTKRDFLSVANVPSQSVCARWMASLEKSLYTTGERSFFGVRVDCGNDDFMDVVSESSFVPFPIEVDGLVAGKTSRIYYPDNSYEGSTANGYILDFITMNDGWLNELFYYSPAPYQTYVVWSAGPNGKTFPPWISRDKLSAADNKNIGAWIADDIVNQSN